MRVRYLQAVLDRLYQHIENLKITKQDLENLRQEILRTKPQTEEGLEQQIEAARDFLDYIESLDDECGTEL